MSDVTPIRRRGRPPGSKNHPKPERVSLADIPIEPEPGWRSDPMPLDFAAELQRTYLPVHIQYKPAMGGSAIEQEADVEWPANWPLPLIGQNVNVGDFGGTLVGVTFDLAKQRLAFRLQ